MPFPTPELLDDFSGGSEDPITTNWTTPHYTGRNQARRRSAEYMERVVVNTTVWGAAYDLATFGPDLSMVVTLGNVTDTSENFAFFFCQSDINYDNGTGYFLVVDFNVGTDTWRFYKWDGATATALGTSQTQEVVSGDLIGIIRSGDRIEAWHRTSGPTDTQVISITDSTYFQAGYVMVEGSNGSNFTVDDFSAETIQSDYASEVLADAPWLYWRLNNQSGTVAQDYSGNSRHGTYSGSPTLAQSGLIESDSSDLAVSFDATNDYCLSNAIFNSGPATVEVWFEYSGTPPGADAYIAGCTNGDGGSQFDKFIWMDTSGRVSFHIFDGVGRDTSVGAALSAGKHHLVGAVPAAAAETMRMYVDGVEYGTHTPTNGSFTGYAANNVLVAGSNVSFGRLAGKRDEFAIYTTDLSAARILAHYEAAFVEEVVLGYVRAYGPAQLAAAAATLYTVPDGARAQLRSINFNNPSGSLRKVTLSIGPDADSTRFTELLDIPAGESIDYSRAINHTLEAGEIIQGYADSAGVVVATINAWLEGVSA